MHDRTDCTKFYAISLAITLNSISYKTFDKFLNIPRTYMSDYEQANDGISGHNGNDTDRSGICINAVPDIPAVSAALVVHHVNQIYDHKP
jgi:hypothetical protein